MAVSMTGYGRGYSQYGSGHIIAEIKTVNHRFSDFHFRMPKQLMMLEDSLRQLISSKIKRGKIDIHITVEGITPSTKQARVDWELINQYLDLAEKLEHFNVFDSRLTLQEFLFHPDIVMVEEKAEVDQECIEAVKDAANHAVEELYNMRIIEGRKLAEDILARIQTIRDLTDIISEKAPAVINNFRERLHERITDLLDGRNVDEDRLLSETAIYADKVNIDEEITRLYAHCDHFVSVVNGKDVIGRKLDFLAQEMNREINTIGSKASDAGLSHHVVDIKSELEKIKEQVQNIE